MAHRQPQRRAPQPPTVARRQAEPPPPPPPQADAIRTQPSGEMGYTLTLFPPPVAPLQKEKEPTLQSRMHVDHRRRPMTSAKRAQPRHAERSSRRWRRGGRLARPKGSHLHGRGCGGWHRAGGRKWRRKGTTPARIAPPDRLVGGRGAARGWAWKTQRGRPRATGSGPEERARAPGITIGRTANPAAAGGASPRTPRAANKQAPAAGHPARAPRPRASRADGKDHSAATVHCGGTCAPAGGSVGSAVAWRACNSRDTQAAGTWGGGGQGEEEVEAGGILRKKEAAAR